MIANDMKLKRDAAMKKVWNAINANGGHTLLSTGITGDDARLAAAVVEAGVKMLEPNHPALALARGHKGVTSMHDAEGIRYEITVAQMAEVTRGVRAVVPDDVYITVGIPGGFTELMPVELMEKDFYDMAMSGADGLHVHKSSPHDLEAVCRLAHKYGLCVDAYIGKSTDRHVFGLPADTHADVGKVARQMEDMGVDLIGLMTSMSYDGLSAGEIPQDVIDRLGALVGAVKVPTLAEGGINSGNFKAFKSTGVNILVVGTSLDDVARKAVQAEARVFLEQ